MRFRSMVALSFAFIVSPLAMSQDEFKYDSKTNRCVNSAGQEGRNEENDGKAITRECGPFYWYQRKSAPGTEIRGMSGKRVPLTQDLSDLDLRGARFINLVFKQRGWVQIHTLCDGTGEVDSKCLVMYPGYSHGSVANFKGADLRGAKFEYTDSLDKAHLEGAKFDERTELPFSRQTALKKGMIFISSEAESSKSSGAQ